MKIQLYELLIWDLLLAFTRYVWIIQVCWTYSPPSICIFYSWRSALGLADNFRCKMWRSIQTAGLAGLASFHVGIHGRDPMV
jgi:hypothetical protein